MKNKKVILYMVMAFLLVALVFSAPPFSELQTFSGTAGLQIQYPIVEVGKVDTVFYPHFHIYNLSNGYIYRNGDNINCTLHIYNNLGQHIYINHSTIFTNVFDISFILPKSTFPKSGVYSYIIQCETFDRSLGGFDSKSIVITNKGIVMPEYNIIAIIIISIFTIIIFIVSGIINYKMAGENQNKISFWLMLLSFGMAVTSFVSLLFTILLYNLGSNLIFILKINAYLIGITMLGVGLGTIFVIMMRIFDFSDGLNDSNTSKWGDDKRRQKTM